MSPGRLSRPSDRRRARISRFANRPRWMTWAGSWEGACRGRTGREPRPGRGGKGRADRTVTPDPPFGRVRNKIRALQGRVDAEHDDGGVRPEHSGHVKRGVDIAAGPCSGKDAVFTRDASGHRFRVFRRNGEQVIDKLRVRARAYSEGRCLRYRELCVRPRRVAAIRRVPRP